MTSLTKVPGLFPGEKFQGLTEGPPYRRNTMYRILKILILTAVLLLFQPCSSSELTAETAYGFFNSPPEISLESVFQLYDNLGRHADAVLYQSGIPWMDFKDNPDEESEKIDDLKNQMILAHRENLEGIFIIDPLNGLNRREFQQLPEGWKAGFRNPDVRSAMKNFALRIVREFHPRYLGLASEINTYADAYPEDFEYFLSLYRDIYDTVKKEAPETKIFVTFQWEDLNNLWYQPGEKDYFPEVIKWNQMEIFEPRLDLWVISSYPYITFPSAEDIPENYYTPLLTRTDKELAIAEGGWISEDFRLLEASEGDQEGYLNAIHRQIGNRMAFWIYLLIQDISTESYSQYIKGKDLDTLGYFTTVGLISPDGTPKAALSLWDRFRERETVEGIYD